MCFRNFYHVTVCYTFPANSVSILIQAVQQLNPLNITIPQAALPDINTCLIRTMSPKMTYCHVLCPLELLTLYAVPPANIIIFTASPKNCIMHCTP